MNLGRAVLVVVCVLALGWLAPPVAAAATPTQLVLSGADARAGDPSTIRVSLSSSGGPVAGAGVVVERQVGGGWQPLATVVTGADGTATTSAPLSPRPAENLFRASYAGDDTHDAATAGPVAVRLLLRRSVVTLTGPASFVDERSAVLLVGWRGDDGRPATGTVRLLRRTGGGGWRVSRAVAVGADGRARVRVAPRVDTRWRVETPRLPWLEAGRSDVHRLDNRPPGRAVRWPVGAPRPRIALPPQARATAPGAAPVVVRIPDRVWRSMVGRSWHRGCPVGRAGLRLVRVNYWDYDGYRRRGEVVAAAGAAERMAGALAEMYRRRLPIRAMYRVDRFGWSHRLGGADDYRSMAAGNTSAFNCRDVVNRPGVRSPHSWGRSLDVNTWENPYRSATGLVPNAWWQPRSHPRIAWRSRAHVVVRLMARHGLRWTYGRGDTQHFDAAHHGRVVLPRDCRGVVCH
ncbi:M15 family metallopeptidase [Nocardioides sp. SYSU D00038]|uniref:M15 family metallopeptidase n=1 Tax=Nocardioides sp. SYSU D00038 TaxID=2812554 RepID=UPI0019684CF1|nr:M15 family metallopeptidase [Nocardioides sp. SYSU D00038]